MAGVAVVAKVLLSLETVSMPRRVSLLSDPAVPDTASVRLTVTVSPVSVSATDALPLALSLVLVSVSVLAIGPPKTFGVLFAPTA